MIRLIFSFILFLLIQSASAKISEPPVPGKWTLTFNEDFDSFDKSIWTTKLETSKLTLGRSECFFRDDNVEVKDGNLVIITKKEKLELLDLDGKMRKMKFTSGFVHNFRNFRQKYGYFEARMKLPLAKGLWPAFWLMPDRSLDSFSSFQTGMRSTKIEKDSSVLLPGKGMEIDIMEYLTEWEGKKFHYAAHWDGYGDDLKSYRSYYKKSLNLDDYHKFGLLWQKDLLVWFIDDVEIGRWQNERISDVPMYIIFSTNVGGWATSWVQKKKLPDYTLVDYVRVWQAQ